MPNLPPRLHRLLPVVPRVPEPPWSLPRQVPTMNPGTPSLGRNHGKMDNGPLKTGLRKVGIPPHGRLMMLGCTSTMAADFF